MVDGTILLTGNTYLCFVQVNSLETSQVAWLDMLASWANKESGLLNISIGVVCIGAPTLVLDAIVGFGGQCRIPASLAFEYYRMRPQAYAILKKFIGKYVADGSGEFGKRKGDGMLFFIFNSDVATKPQRCG